MYCDCKTDYYTLPPSLCLIPSASLLLPSSICGALLLAGVGSCLLYIYSKKKIPTLSTHHDIQSGFFLGQERERESFVLPTTLKGATQEHQPQFVYDYTHTSHTESACISLSFSCLRLIVYRRDGFLFIVFYSSVLMSLQLGGAQLGNSSCLSEDMKVHICRALGELS